MTQEMKPCPFCGGCSELDSQQFFVDYQGHPAKQVAAYCVGSCGATITLCYGDTPDMELEDRVAYVREQWNRRAPQHGATDCGITDAMVDAALEEAGEWDGIDALSMRGILEAAFALLVPTPLVPNRREYYGDNDRDRYFADGWNSCLNTIDAARAKEAKRSDAESWRTAGARIAEACPEGRFKDKP